MNPIEILLFIQGTGNDAVVEAVAATGTSQESGSFIHNENPSFK